MIRSHLSASFYFELSGNSNYNTRLLLYPLMSGEAIRRLENNFDLRGKFELTVYCETCM